MQESSIENYLKRKVNNLGGWVVKLNSASMRGLPDRMILMPGGNIYFVELKAPGKKPRPLQNAVIKGLKRLGFIVLVIDTKESAGEFINGIQASQISEHSNK